METPTMDLCLKKYPRAPWVCPRSSHRQAAAVNVQGKCVPPMSFSMDNTTIEKRQMPKLPQPEISKPNPNPYEQKPE